MSTSSENAGEAAPESSSLPAIVELNEILPGFEVTDFLAQGGMGAIYKGLQTKLDREVAIKVLPHSYGEEYDYASRFEIEAKAMAKLSHNNIVSVYDYGETTDGNYLYFVMEYIEGSNLYQLLQNGPLEVDQAINVLRQVCAGLQYAHEHGIIHRDIKPSNILVDQRGVVKMADFGLAKVSRGGARTQRLIQMGDEGDTVMGTPEYIAPEALIEGVEIDYRADIYSVGVLIYELLTGELPQGDYPPPSKFQPGIIDRRFDEIVKNALLEDRSTRTQQISLIDRALAKIGKAPKLITGKGSGGKRRARPRARRPSPPARKVPMAPPNPGGPTPNSKPAPSPKRKMPAPAARPAAGGTRPRPRVRHRPPVPQKSPASAMVAIGLAFVVIVLIGVAMMFFKNRGQDGGEERKPIEPKPMVEEKPKKEEKKKEKGGSDFFGVPLE